MKLVDYARSLLLVTVFLQCCWAYEVPQASFNVYRRGFEVSIPHEEGITLFAFHGNLNKEMDGQELGAWSRDVIRAENGRWTFRNFNAELKLGDTIYYWIYVLKDGIGYIQENGVFEVDHYSHGLYEVPTPKFEIYRKGFEVSIPHEEGITLFAFHGNLNKEMDGKVLGDWSRDVVRAENGRWTFRNFNVELKLGDTIYYWIYVLKDGIGYIQENGVFEVDHYSSRQTFASDGVYEVPTPKFEIYRKGFEVSIPHEEGITLFAFHGNLNKEMDGQELGDWSRDVIKAENGRWIFRNFNAELKLGDTIYYWIYVLKDGLGHLTEHGVFEVDHYSSRETLAFDGLYEVPPPKFKIYRKGFEVSIPYEEGISMFTFTGQLDKQNDSSSMSQDWNYFTDRPLNGSLVIYDHNTELELGDNITFAIAVRKYQSFYYLDDVYEVKQYA